MVQNFTPTIAERVGSLMGLDIPLRDVAKYRGFTIRYLNIVDQDSLKSSYLGSPMYYVCIHRGN